MNKHSIINLTALTALGLILIPGSAFAQQKPLKDQIVGTWTAVSWEQVRKDGTKFERFGSEPKGVTAFDPNGRFYVMYARSDLPKFAVSDPMKSTAAENKNIAEGAIAYFGTYSVDEATKTVSLRVEASTFPNQTGTDQKRTVSSISGNDLKFTNPTALSGEHINYVLKRAATLASN